MKRQAASLQSNPCPTLERLEPRLLLTGDVIISEFLASNEAVFADGYGEYRDWIELRNASPEPVDLTGWKLVDSDAQWPLPPIVLGVEEYVVFFASDRDGQDPAGYWHTNFKLSASGDYLALVDGTDTVVHEYRPEFPEQLEDISYGVLYEHHTGVPLIAKGAPAKYTVPTATPAADWVDMAFDETGWFDGTTGLGFGLSSVGGAVTLIEAGSTWRYLDDGSDQGSAWKEVGFSDTAWSAGLAELGYGDGDEETVVGYGPSASDKYITTYFRRTFSVTNAWSVTDLTLRILRDDGAVMYLNGSELPRSNMPDGAIDHLTLASGGANETTWYEYTIDPGLLAEGENVLAVEIHQRSATSTDISFDLELIAQTSPADVLETNIGAEMLGVSPSALVRVPFAVNDPEEFSSLILKMAYEDAFVAYLNGVPVASRNAPPSPGWSSTALSDRAEADALQFETIDLTAFLPLLVDGDNVLAIHALNDGPADPTFLICPKLTGLGGQTMVESYFTTPTPGEPNVPGVIGMVEDTSFSVDRGFYDTPQSVEITTATPGAEIRYTLDGSEPTATTATPYTGPISVTTTTTLRAAAFKPGYLATNVDTHTYIFLDDVIRQPTNPAGFPNTWYTRAADYEMDPAVVNDPLYSGQIIDALRTRPTISLVMNVDDLFDQDIGIYSNSTQKGDAWERPVSVELIDFPWEDNDQLDGGLRLQGNASRASSRPKHNLRLVFRSEYGSPMMDFQLFEDSSVDSFNSLILRGQNGDSWIHPNANQRRRGQYARDQWHRDVQEAMGYESLDQADYHVYINGLYWGLHHVFVRAEAEWMAETFGGSKGDYDVVQDLNKQAGKVEAIDGDVAAWNTMVSLAAGDITNPATYEAFQQYMDMENFVDYLLLNFYSGNTDWDGGNWRAARKREEGAGFIFFPWDSERTVGDSAKTSLVTTTNITGKDVASRASGMHQDLTANDEYRLFFADRVHKHFFNGGVLTPLRAADLWQRRVDQIRLALVAEAARWGDAHRPDDPYTPEDEWMTEVNLLMGSYFPVRTGIVLNQLKAKGLYPDVAAPSFRINGLYQHGGVISAGDSLSMTGQGTIYYTLDGTDPRSTAGGPSATASVYSGAISLNRSTHVKARSFSGGRWSALNEAEYVVDTLPEIRVTEMMYNPAAPSAAEYAAGFADNDEFEFIEVRNVGARTVDLLNVRFVDGVQYTFPTTVLHPGQYAVIAESRAAFAERYGLPAAGQYTGAMDNNGERVVLESPLGEVIQEFTYSDWHGQTDGEGHSLNIVDADGDPAAWSKASGWFASSAVHGTPGGGDTGFPAGSVVINEVLAHSDGGVEDWIELHNTTDEPIDIGGWFLSDQKADDDGNNMLTKYEIASPTVIQAGGYAVFNQTDHFGDGSGDPGSHVAFALSEHGDDVYLSSGSGGSVTGYREHVDFNASPNGVSFGLFVDAAGGTDFTLLSDTSSAAPNDPPFLGDLVLNEVMYHPADPTLDEIAAGFTNDDDFEFVELYNSSAWPIDLREYHLDDAVGWTFGWYDTDDFATAAWTLEKGATAAWTPSLTQAGAYEVLVYVSADDGDGGLLELDSRAEYEVVHRDGSTVIEIDQNLLAGNWASLGTFYFDGGAASVTLTRGADEPDERTIADQVRFVADGVDDLVDDEPDLSSWALANASPTLAAGGYAVLVADYAAFDMRYGIAANGIPVLGEYEGSLSNDGETLRLFRAGRPEEETGFIPQVRVDKLAYNDVPPWAPHADGLGASLARLDPDSYGNDPGNWAPGTINGTPGGGNTFLDRTPPSIPAEPAASAVSGDRIDLTWTASVDPESGVAFYTVYRDGAELATTVTPGWSDTTVAADTLYVYEIDATNGDGFISDRSTPVGITVVGIVLISSPDGLTVRVVFTEPLDAATAEQHANYALTGATVTAASLEPDGLTVELTTSELQEEQTYTLTVSNVTAVSGNPLPQNLEHSFVYAPTGSGNILREYWTGIPGTSVGDLTSNANFPGNPTGFTLPETFEAPTDWTDTFGTRMRGYVHPPISGNYTFWIASDEAGELWLSTDDAPANAAVIASVASRTDPREWTRFASQQSVEISLEAGRKYYVEALHKEGAGSDNLAVGWQWPDGTYERPIPGVRLSPVAIPDLPPSITVDTIITLDATPPITGTVTDPDAMIIIRVNGGAYLATNHGDGTWSLADNRISPPLPDGTYDVLATATKGTRTGYDATVDELIVDAEAPTVEAVRVASTSWSAAFLAALGEGGYTVPTGAGQLEELPWVNIDRIMIVFSEDTTVSEGDLSIHGVNTSEYPVAAFEYDTDTLTATWTLPGPVASDKLLLALGDTVTDNMSHALDGEWTDTVSTYSSGDGLAGGDFLFQLSVLPGDADQSSEVRSSDVIKVRRKSNTSPGDADYCLMHDVDGSGEVRSSDVIKVRRLGNTTLPDGEPTVPPAAPPAPLTPPAADVETAAALDPLEGLPAAGPVTAEPARADEPPSVDVLLQSDAADDVGREPRLAEPDRRPVVADGVAAEAADGSRPDVLSVLSIPELRPLIL